MGDKIEKNVMGGACVLHMGERSGEYWVLVGEPEGKRPLGRPQHKWDDDIKWIFRKWDGEGHVLD
jgi:hypothetical protein